MGDPQLPLSQTVIRSRTLDIEEQSRAPLFEALKEHIREGVTPFHVPAHKHGHGLSEMREYCGDNMFLMDVNAMGDVDDLSNPVSVIDDAQRLAAEAFGAEYAYYLINGTTSGVHAMMLTALRPGDRIILPRNCHKSAFSGLILSGAVPVYAPVEMNEELGIAMGATVDALRDSFRRAPQSAAVFTLNPNYYGFTGDLENVVRLTREYDAVLMVDEAHGGHMYFHESLPATAMESGADMAVISTHKTCGSLTQSSMLLSSSRTVTNEKILNTLNLLRTTSASYLLMASLDVSRKQMAVNGRDMLARTLELANYARNEINKIKGLYCFGRELIDNQSVFNFDDTKINIHVRRLGMTGFEMERRLRQEYNIQVELADLNNIMAMVTVGDDEENINRLVQALKSISLKCRVQKFKRVTLTPDMPETIVTPRDAFYSFKKSVPLEKAVNEISGEMVMAYPPGIPVICPGERITQDIVDYITILKEHNCHLQGAADPFVNYIRVLGF
ncbi:MAG: aminotransferase class I/II-fold pyridoxal phosphate-dependent enzyme [Leptospirales bacterium]|nr:aminotransferase class I/II-fold pyridoxal phosphate-dependent enzyme [Leptospirales bacterium]